MLRSCCTLTCMTGVPHRRPSAGASRGPSFLSLVTRTVAVWERPRAVASARAAGRAVREQPASYPARERGEATAFGGQYGASRPGPNALAGCDRAGGALRRARKDCTIAASRPLRSPLVHCAIAAPRRLFRRSSLPPHPHPPAERRGRRDANENRACDQDSPGRFDTVDYGTERP